MGRQVREAMRDKNRGQGEEGSVHHDQGDDLVLGQGGRPVGARAEGMKEEAGRVL